MKFIKLTMFLCLNVCISTAVFAADWQQEVNDLRKEVQQLYRKIYDNDEASVNSNPENTEMKDKIDEYGSTLRRINERLDVLDSKIKQYTDNLDKYNKNMDIRLKALESSRLNSSMSAPMEIKQPIAQNQASGQIINANNPDEMYKNAMNAYNKAFYDEAELTFKDLISQFPRHALAGNAQYWLGEVYTKQGNLNKAKAAFKDGYEKYMNGNKAPDSLYRLGMTLKANNEKQKACIVFMSFNEVFPKANADLSKKVKAEAQKLGCK